MEKADINTIFYTRIRIPILVLLAITSSGKAQLVTAHCVHSSGIQFLLDAYLASLGACNCQRTGVFLTDFPDCNTNPYVIQFEDNFDQDSLDLSKWQQFSSGGVGGDQRMEYSSYKNVSLKDGICYITARKETVAGKAVHWMADNEIMKDGKENLRTYNYTSGILQSVDKLYTGKYEIRCRMPSGNGFWPAFWLFGGKRYNELDIFDSYAGTGKVVTSMGHEYEEKNVSGCHDSKGGFDLTAWHTFACELERDKVVFYVDDKPIRTIYRVLTLSGDPVLCGSEVGHGSYFQLKSFVREPMHIIVDMYLISENGPAGSKPVDETTPFPASLEVDYVRYWQRHPAEIKVWPNPAQDKVTVESEERVKTIQVQTLLGQVLFKSTVAANSFEFDLGSQPDGIYILNIELEGTSRAIKVVKVGM